MASQAVVGTGHAMPILKSQLKSVLPSFTDLSASTHVESPCATAANKRTSNETSSIGGNTLVGSSVTDFSYKDTVSKPEDSSDGDHDAQAITKEEPSSNDEAVGQACKIGPSPSKAGKAKL